MRLLKIFLLKDVLLARLAWILCHFELKNCEGFLKVGC